ncbi:unnamed protein product, partial [Durusdinium trenchii]
SRQCYLDGQTEAKEWSLRRSVCAWFFGLVREEIQRSAVPVARSAHDDYHVPEECKRLANDVAQEGQKAYEKGYEDTEHKQS